MIGGTVGEDGGAGALRRREWITRLRGISINSIRMSTVKSISPPALLAGQSILILSLFLIMWEGCRWDHG